MAECFELFDEAAGAVFGGMAAGEPVGAEFAEGDVVADDVVVGDQDVVAERFVSGELPQKDRFGRVDR